MAAGITVKFQQPSEIICLRNGWEYWEGSPLYNEGSRVKSEVVCQHASPLRLIRPNWHYLFKQSRSRYPWQFWMEIAAYRIGRVIGVDVPLSHAAIGFDGEPGSLTEWMYNAESSNEGMMLGGEFMLKRDANYDRKKGLAPGHCHSLELVIPIMRWSKGIDGFLRFITFDTLIANTDRHHDNWGLLWRSGFLSDELEISLAPAFDNGTSLGHERLEEKLSEILNDPDWFQRHATHAAARHHIRLHPGDEKGASMLDLVPELLHIFPGMLPTIRQCATFRDEDIRNAVYPLCDFDMPVRLSENRAEFICRMVCERRDMLMERLDAKA